MLCQECKQRQASVHLTKIINDRKTELHLCDECARQRDDFLNITPFSVNDLIASFLDMGKPQVSFEKPVQKKCPACGRDYNKFKKSGFLGCRECYKNFSSDLEPVLEKIQARTEHTGKVPKRSGTEIAVRKQLAELKSELRRAVEAEEYEKAAQIRDRIKLMEQSGKKGGTSGELDK